MKTLVGAFAGLLALFPASAVAQEAPPTEARDQQIQELQDKMEQLERELDDLRSDSPKDRDPAENAGLEARLDEVIHQSPAEPYVEPTRLNFSAPALDAVSWSGHFRWRTAYWDDFPTGVGTQDEAFSADQSAELGILARVSDKVQFKVALRDARVWGTDVTQTAAPDNNLEMTTAYVDMSEVYDSGFNLRIGRQDIVHGKGRQFGDDPWRLQPVRWDGITVHSEIDSATNFHGHLLRLADGDSRFPNEFGPGAGIGGDTAELYALYLTHNGGDSIGVFDLYYMYLDSDPDAPSGFSGGSGRETQLHTYGGRWSQDMDGIWWDLEAATQFGTVLGSRIGNYGFSNWALAAQAGYRMPDDSLFGGVRIGYDYASGGEDIYVQLAPELHGWFGLTDQHSWTNVVHFSAAVDFNVLQDPEAPDNLSVSWHWLNVADTDQGFAGYNNGASAAAIGGDKDVGQELDIAYHCKCTNASAIDLGIGWFFPGDAYTNAFGEHDDVKLAFLRYGIRF